MEIVHQFKHINNQTKKPLNSLPTQFPPHTPQTHTLTHTLTHMPRNTSHKRLKIKN